MAFSHATDHSQIKLSAKEMFAISQEISRKFAPHVVESNRNRDFTVPLSRQAERPAPRQLIFKSTSNRLADPGLSSLTRRELLTIARIIRQEYAPRFSRSRSGRSTSILLSARELLAVSEAIRRDFTDYTAKMALGGTQLVLLPVDPGHFHVYWQIAEETEIDVQEPAQPLLLRLVPEAGGEVSPERSNDGYFDIVVDAVRGQRKIEVPRPLAGVVSYRALLGKNVNGGGFAVVARSNIVRLLGLSVSAIVEDDVRRHRSRGVSSFSAVVVSGWGLLTRLQ